MTLAITRMYSSNLNSPKRNRGEFFAFWKDELERMSSTHILHWTVDHFYPRLALKTAFEPEGCLILSLLSEIVPRVTVVCGEMDYQMQRFWNVTSRFYRKTGLEIVPVHSIDPDRFDMFLDGTRRQEWPGARVLGGELAIPTVSPLVRWTRDAIIRKLERDGILDLSFINIWTTES